MERETEGKMEIEREGERQTCRKEATHSGHKMAVQAKGKNRHTHTHTHTHNHTHTHTYTNTHSHTQETPYSCY